MPRKKCLTILDLVQMFSSVDESFNFVNISTVSSKLQRLQDQRKKLGHKKKVNGVKNLKELRDQQFVSPCVSIRKQSIVQGQLNLEI